VHNVLKKLYIVLIVILARCTSILQPLDTYINKVFKRHIKVIIERLIEGYNLQELIPRLLQLITIEAIL
jgi:hypothetical protein